MESTNQVQGSGELGQISVAQLLNGNVTPNAPSKNE